MDTTYTSAEALERMEPPLWEEEDFEECVRVALSSLYDVRAHHKTRDILPPHKIRPADVRWLRGIGAYFPPPSSVTVPRVFEDYKTDLPAFTSHTFVADWEREPNVIRPDKIALVFLRRYEQYSRVVPVGTGTLYALYQLFSRNHRLMMLRDFVTVEADGSVLPCLTRITKIVEGRQGRRHREVVAQRELVEAARKGTTVPEDIQGDLARLVVQTTASINWWGERRRWWLVEAEEGEARATFGVSHEQIQSLFYARELPVTATGRKRPILHWVKAHRRRMQDGTEVDIQAHLRGTNEIVWDGTLFRIHQPLKTPGHSYAETYPKKDGTPRPIAVGEKTWERTPPTVKPRRRFLDWIYETFIAPFRRDEPPRL